MQYIRTLRYSNTWNRALRISEKGVTHNNIRIDCFCFYFRSKLRPVVSVWDKHTCVLDVWLVSSTYTRLVVRYNNNNKKNSPIPVSVCRNRRNRWKKPKTEYDRKRQRTSLAYKHEHGRSLLLIWMANIMYIRAPKLRNSLYAAGTHGVQVTENSRAQV